MHQFIFIFFSILTFGFHAQGSYELAVLKYNGGGDYYANPTSVPNLIGFYNKTFNTNISKEVPYVEASSKDIFDYPFILLLVMILFLTTKSKKHSFLSSCWRFCILMIIMEWTSLFDGN